MCSRLLLRLSFCLCLDLTLVISAMQKVVIKNLVDYLELRIAKPGEVING